MNIRIDEKYSLKSDPRNVILVENKTVQDGKNKGEIREVPISYHATVQCALKDYLRIKTNLSEAATIQELLQDIKKIEKTIEAVLNGN